MDVGRTLFDADRCRTVCRVAWLARSMSRCHGSRGTFEIRPPLMEECSLTFDERLFSAGQLEGDGNAPAQVDRPGTAALAPMVASGHARPAWSQRTSQRTVLLSAQRSSRRQEA